MKQCSKCILTENFEGIQFDEKGLCSLCGRYTTMCHYEGKEALRKEIEENKGNSRYDCLVPVSGGKDSIYALFYCKEILGFNPVAFNYDSGYQTDIASNNIKNACKILDVPLVQIRGKFTDKMSKINLLIGCAGGEDAEGSTGGKGRGNLRVCGNCDALMRALSIQTARKWDIGCILWGSHSIEDEMASKLMDRFYRRLGQQKKKPLRDRIRMRLLKLKTRVYKQDGRLFVNLLGWNVPARKLYLTFIYYFWSTLQKLTLHLPLRMAFEARSKVPFTQKSPKFILIYDYVDFFYFNGGDNDPKSNVEVLKSKLNWICPPERESRFDCAIHCLGNYFFMQKNNVTLDGAKLCNHIREGQMDKAEVAAREKAVSNTLMAECDAFLDSINAGKIRLREISDKGGLLQNQCVYKTK